MNAAAALHVAPPFVKLADASGRLLGDRDHVVSQALTAIVVTEVE
jgi:hypothetical protein